MADRWTNVFDYDAELRRYHRRLLEAIDVRPDDSVLDIGCGAGQTTRDAARLATRGNALGVDVSSTMLARARELSAEFGNVHFEQADAQTHPFPSMRFTLGISRFGTMFFADPVSAFTNIGRALRPEARLVQLVWQGSDQQEWVSSIQRAFGTGAPAVNPFSLADPAVIDDVLTAAGFTDIDIADVREPVWYGANPDAAAEAVLALRMASGALGSPDDDETKRALERLRTVMTEHNTPDGVWFDSRAWIITARH